MKRKASKQRQEGGYGSGGFRLDKLKDLFLRKRKDSYVVKNSVRRGIRRMLVYNFGSLLVDVGTYLYLAGYSP